MPSPPRRLLSIEEVAEQLDCSVQHVRNLITAGELHAVNINLGNRKMRFKVPESDVSKFIARRQIS